MWYSCLHPNLAISIYGGNSQHTMKIANSIDIDEHKVK
jgi:hypothetical protein